MAISFALMFACCDESAGSRWWVYGSVWMPDHSRLAQYEAEATSLRQRTNCWGEFKWEKVGPTHLETYQEFLKLTLAQPRLKFATIVIDTRLFTQAGMEKYHADGGEQLAYLKFMRQLLRERIRRFAKRDDPGFVILYDKLSVAKKHASTFREVLMADMSNLSLEKGFELRFDHLSQANSAILHLLQAADLLTGATRWAWEGAAGSGKKAEARAKVRSQIEEWAGGDLTHESFPPGRYYSAWRWSPSE